MYIIDKNAENEIIIKKSRFITKLYYIEDVNNVNDIINELNSNIIPLEEASKKAKKYIEYKDRLSNIEVAVIAKEIKDLNFEYQEGKKKIEELENEINKVTTDSSTYDIDILKYKDKLKEVRDNINKSQVLLIDLSKREEKITSDIRLLQERNKYKGEESLISNNIIRLFEVLLIVIIFYRYMSKNIKLRKKENDKYLEIKDKIIKLFDYNKKKYKDPKTENIGGTDVELYYGDGGRIALAQWTSGGYSHQIYSESGASLNSIKLMVVGFSR